MNKIKGNKLVVGLAATAILGLGGTGYFAYSAQKVEAQMDRVEVRATNEVAKTTKQLNELKVSSEKQVKDLTGKVSNKDKEVTSLKKKLEQSKSAEQEEIKAREIAAQQQVDQVTVETTQPVQRQQVEQVSVAQAAPARTDNWHKNNRRQVENSGKYTWDGYYIGAYQFDPNTWASTAASNGLNPNDYSPANQDAMADAYANDRWGGWQNVPTSGGW